LEAYVARLRSTFIWSTADRIVKPDGNETYAVTLPSSADPARSEIIFSLAWVEHLEELATAATVCGTLSLRPMPRLARSVRSPRRAGSPSPRNRDRAPRRALWGQLAYQHRNAKRAFALEAQLQRQAEEKAAAKRQQKQLGKVLEAVSEVSASSSQVRVLVRRYTHTTPPIVAAGLGARHAPADAEAREQRTGLVPYAPAADEHLLSLQVLLVAPSLSVCRLSLRPQDILCLINTQHDCFDPAHALCPIRNCISASTSASTWMFLSLASTTDPRLACF
jgi:hypothetical protein